MKVTVDPNTQASGFDYVDPSQQRLRIVKVELRKKEFPYLAWEFEFADANVKGIKGGTPGHIFDNTTLKSGENAQFRLKQLCEALGLTWGDFDTEQTIGQEFDCFVKLDEYNGVIKNVVDKYIAVKK